MLELLKRYELVSGCGVLGRRVVGEESTVVVVPIISSVEDEREGAGVVSVDVGVGI